jgi:hypothetical protein
VAVGENYESLVGVAQLTQYIHVFIYLEIATACNGYAGKARTAFCLGWVTASQKGASQLHRWAWAGTLRSPRVTRLCL